MGNAHGLAMYVIGANIEQWLVHLDRQGSGNLLAAHRASFAFILIDCSLPTYKSSCSAQS